eukprot:gene20002-23966_t
MQLLHSDFISNAALGKGGAIMGNYCNSTIEYSQFIYNIAATSGAFDL